MWNAGSWCSNQWTTAMYECLQDTKVTLVSFEKPLWRNVTVRLWERIVRWVYKRQKQIYSPGHFSLRVDRKALLSIHNAALWSSGPDADSVYRYVWLCLCWKCFQEELQTLFSLIDMLVYLGCGLSERFIFRWTNCGWDLPTQLQEVSCYLWKSWTHGSIEVTSNNNIPDSFNKSLVLRVGTLRGEI